MQFRRSPSCISRRCERENDSDRIAIACMRVGWMLRASYGPRFKMVTTMV